MSSENSQLDYEVSGGGTVYILTPLNSAAKENLESGLSDEAMWFADGVAQIYCWTGSTTPRGRVVSCMNTAVHLDAFTTQYLATALWAETDNTTPQGGEPLDSNYAIVDFAPEAIERAIADCTKFQQDNVHILEQVYAIGIEPSTAGHDFWLTRNHHGAGFWDGDYPEEHGKSLTEAAHAFGELNPYAENGKVFFE